MLKKSILLSLAISLSTAQIVAASEPCNSALEGKTNWLEIVEQTQGKVKNTVNPFGPAGVDADRIGEIHQQFRKAFPVYDSVLEHSFAQNIKEAEFRELQAKVLMQKEALLKSNSASAAELFALQESARIMSMLETRVVSEAEEGVSTDPNEEKKEEQQEKKEQGQGQDSKPEWQPPSDEYNPENKNVSMGGGESHEMLRTTSDVPSRLLKEIVYDVVNTKGWVVNTAIRPTRVKTAKPIETDHTIITTHGAKEITIPFSYNAEPIVGVYTGFEIQEVKPGEFKLFIKNAELKQIRVPLQEKVKEVFSSAHNLTYYLGNKQIPLNWWPEDIQVKVKMLQQSALSPLQKAQELEKFFQKDGGYLYYSEGNLLSKADLKKVDAIVSEKMQSLPKPVAMAFGKAINCDGAAWIGALLNREYLQIPTRIVGGKTVSKKVQVKEGDVYSVSDSGSPAHAWMEVWNETEWVPLDYTPLENQPKSSSDQKKPESGDEKSKPEDGEKKSEQSANKAEESKDKKDGEKGEEGKEKQKGEEFVERVIDENGDLPEISTTKPRMPLSKIIPEVLQRTFLERLLMESSRNKLKDEFFSYAENAASGSRYSTVDQTILSGMRVLENAKDEEIGAWLGQARLKLSLGDLYGAWNEIQAIEKLINMITATRSLTAAEKVFESKLRQVLIQFQAIRHPDAAAYELAIRVYDSLPGPASKWFVRSTYGEDVLTLGSQSSKKFAKALEEGKLAPLVRMAMLSGYTDMVLNSEWIPAYETRASIYRSPVPTKKQDIVVARSALEFQRMLLQPRPGEHIFEPLFQGRQFAIGSRETKQVPSRKAPLEKKFSVVFYDISSSMDGDNVAYQDALLMNFADHAAAEKDLLGNPLHELIVIPFGDEVYPKRAASIKNIEDAKKFIQEKVNHQTDTPDGTDIEKALLYFYDVVARAHEKNIASELKPFQRANLILFSDGGSTIDLSKVLAARKRVPKDIKIYMNFVGIGGTNEEIVELAKTSNLASSQPMVREIKEQEIRDIVNRSQSIEKNKEAFASEIKMSEIPTSLISAVGNLVEAKVDFRLAPDVEKMYQLFNSIKAGPVDLGSLNNKFAPNQLQIYMSKLVKENYPKNIKEEIALRVLEAYPTLSGRPLSQSLLIELDEFNTLMDWVKK